LKNSRLSRFKVDGRVWKRLQRKTTE